MNTEIYGLLEKIGKAWKSAIQNSEAIAEAIAILSKVCISRPLSNLDFCVSSRIKELPKPIEELLKAADKSFRLRTFSRMKKNLNDIIEHCSMKHSSLPESKLLKKVAKKWLKTMEALVEQDSSSRGVILELSPSLDLDAPLEEDKFSEKSRKICLPIKIRNIGNLPILDVKLSFSVEGAVPIDRSEGFKKLSGNEFEISLNKAIAGGQTEVVRIQLLQDMETEINVAVCYKDFLKSFTITEELLAYLKEEGVSYESVEELKNLENHTFLGKDRLVSILKAIIGDDRTVRKKSLITKCVKFLSTYSSPIKSDTSSLSLKLPIAGKNVYEKIKNPYIPDKPLATDWEWGNLMQGKNKNVSKDILMDLRRNNRNVNFIRGITHSGKTSILLDLKYNILEEGNFLPIYINFHTWWDIISKKKISINISGLLYELADSAAQEAAILDLDTSEVDDYLNNFQEDLNMSYQKFRLFVKLLSKVSNKNFHVVFLLDELDWWIQDKKYTEEAAHNLVLYMSGLIQENICSVVVASKWPNQEWKRKLNERKVPLVPNDLAFLEKDDIKKLSALNVLSGKEPLFYTSLALEFIWRVSGGWPGLVQLIFYHIVKRLNDSENPSTLIDIGFIRKIIENIINSDDTQNLISYYLRSFDSSEVSLIRLLTKLHLIRKDTTEIEQIRKSKSKGYFIEDPSVLEISESELNLNLTKLEQKNIIEPIGGSNEQLRLRTGILIYPIVLNLFQGEIS